MVLVMVVLLVLLLLVLLLVLLLLLRLVWLVVLLLVALLLVLVVLVVALSVVLLVLVLLLVVWLRLWLWLALALVAQDAGLGVGVERRGQRVKFLLDWLRACPELRGTDPPAAAAAAADDDLPVTSGTYEVCGVCTQQPPNAAISRHGAVPGQDELRRPLRATLRNRLGPGYALEEGPGGPHPQYDHTI